MRKIRERMLPRDSRKNEPQTSMPSLFNEGPNMNLLVYSTSGAGSPAKSSDISWSTCVFPSNGFNWWTSLHVVVPPVSNPRESPRDDQRGLHWLVSVYFFPKKKNIRDKERNEQNVFSNKQATPFLVRNSNVLLINYGV